MTQNREHWGSKLGFILATAGSAVGLGNIWKFPYITGENGGATFILIYLICILLIGLPVLLAEIVLGRHAQSGPIQAFRKLSGKNKGFWMVLGSIFFITGLIILSYYNIIAGWSVGYLLESVKGTFTQFQTAGDASVHFGRLITDPLWIIGFQFVFVLLGAFVVYKGVNKGIEAIARILMPVFFVILIFLVIWGLSLDKDHAGMRFLFQPDWSTVTFKTVLVALGHAFFTLSVGMGVIITYGSYLKKDDDIFFSGVMIAFLDTFIAILAGIAIFTSVFAMGFDPAAGPGLVFNVLPAVFSKMPGGNMFGFLFFSLLSIAALTSTISILEMMTATLLDETKMSRHHIVILLSLVIFILGIPSALSFGIWSDMSILGLSVFDSLDYLSANILLPLGGLFVALFVGWKLQTSVVRDEFAQGFGNKGKHIVITGIWYFLVKYLAPVLIFLVFLFSIGVIA